VRTISRNRQSFDKLQIRSVERGICPVATSAMNELFLQCESTNRPPPKKKNFSRYFHLW